MANKLIIDGVECTGTSDLATSVTISPIEGMEATNVQTALEEVSDNLTSRHRLLGSATQNVAIIKTVTIPSGTNLIVFELYRSDGSQEIPLATLPPTRISSGYNYSCFNNGTPLVITFMIKENGTVDFSPQSTAVNNGYYAKVSFYS